MKGCYCHDPGHLICYLGGGPNPDCWCCDVTAAEILARRGDPVVQRRFPETSFWVEPGVTSRVTSRPVEVVVLDLMLVLVTVAIALLGIIVVTRS